MNPLANTDLQTYIRNLVNDHLPGKDDGDRDSTPRTKTRHRRSDDKAPPTGAKKDKRAEKA
jgi:hypothetical protein